MSLDSPITTLALIMACIARKMRHVGDLCLLGGFLFRHDQWGGESVLFIGFTPYDPFCVILKVIDALLLVF